MLSYLMTPGKNYVKTFKIKLKFADQFYFKGGINSFVHTYIHTL